MGKIIYTVNWDFLTNVVFIAAVSVFSLSQLIKEYFKWKSAFLGNMLFQVIERIPKNLLNETLIGKEELKNEKI